MGPIVNPSYRLSTSELLDAVPVPSTTVEREHEDEKRLVLRIPLRKQWYMKPPVSWVLRFSSHKRVGLDRAGSEIWKECDGKKTCEQIIEQFSQRHHLRFHEARLSVMQLLKDLTRRGFIALVGRTHKGENE